MQLLQFASAIPQLCLVPASTSSPKVLLLQIQSVFDPQLLAMIPLIRSGCYAINERYVFKVIGSLRPTMHCGHLDINAVAWVMSSGDAMVLKSLTMSETHRVSSQHMPTMDTANA